MTMKQDSSERWSVAFYVDRRGHSPVTDYLAVVPPRDRAKIARYLQLLQEFGPGLSMPHARHIEGRLWELRPDAHRLFYVLWSERRCIVLHAYRKKGQKAPRREIEQALRRLDDYLSRQEGSP